MKIVSYNVNGIRAAIGKGLLQWINAYQPDVLCFQELKATPDQIPLMDFEMMGYHHYWATTIIGFRPKRRVIAVWD